MRHITRKQAECLAFITSFIRENRGVSPTMREIASGIGMAGYSGVRGRLDGLERLGLIRRLNCRARSIQIVAPETGWRFKSTDVFAGLIPSIAEEIATRRDGAA